jgi:hypothetical protein
MAKAKPTTAARHTSQPTVSLVPTEFKIDRHKTFLVPDGSYGPLLPRGRFAVVDTTDRELVDGGVYLFQWNFGERPRRIELVKADRLNITGPGAALTPVWWVRSLQRPPTLKEIKAASAAGRKRGTIPLFGGLSDGPYQTEDLQPKVIGRIVGVASSSLGHLIAPTAGWKNEAEGNAAFDPGEYIDVLLATGHKPYVFGGAKRSYVEELPRRALTEAQNVVFFTVREKFLAASTALARVKQECIRRGLVEGQAVQS